MDLPSILVAAGAPLLKEIIANKMGEVGGKLAGGVIDTLAERLGVPATPEAIGAKVERDADAQVIVREVEAEVRQDLARIAEADRDIMLSYHRVLESDQKAEGWIQARWRGIFALVFTACFAGIVLTVCRAIWISQLTGIEAVGGLLITLIIAGCAVLGVQVYQRSEEKKAGVI
jgi:hypothetical protein